MSKFNFAILNKNPKLFKKIIIIIICIFICIFLCYFIFLKKFNYKNINTGNNNLNKTLDEIQEYICNISSYEATIEVTVYSNKNTNKYKIKQSHEENYDTQEILEPENVKGVKFIYKDNTLQIINTTLNLTKIYNNYPYIENNNLWLNDFLEEYKTANETNKEISEDEREIVLTLQTQKVDSKIKYKELYLDKKTGNPTKLLLQDNNKNTIIYILYSEITLK